MISFFCTQGPYTIRVERGPHGTRITIRRAGTGGAGVSPAIVLDITSLCIGLSREGIPDAAPPCGEILDEIPALPR